MESNIIAVKWTSKKSHILLKKRFLNLAICFKLSFFLFGTALFTCSFDGKSQATKLNFYLQNQVKRHKTRAPESLIHFNVAGDPLWINNYVVKNGGFIKYRNGNISSVALPGNKVEKFAENNHVHYLDYSLSKGYPLNDSMLVNNNVKLLHAGNLDIPEELTGKDVILGFIDTGIEFNHEDFKDSTGRTRVLNIWDQGDTGNPGKVPSLYKYGSVWDSTDINAGNCPQQDLSAHGSTVVGSAASNGRATGNYQGVAPEADIIMVKTNFNASNWLGTVADAVHFIFSRADELNKPCVINASIGDYFGSHDGEDLVAQYIDALLTEKPGRSLVCAAGNSGDNAFHLRGEVSGDTTFTWFKYNASSALGYGSVFFEVWTDTADFNQVKYAVGADKITGNIPHFRGNIPFIKIKENLNKLLTDTLKADGNTLAIVDYYAEQRNGQYLLQVHLAEPDSNQYNFRFITTGKGLYDIWSSSTFGTSDMILENIPDTTQYPQFKKYTRPDINQTMVSSWACSPKVITVANYQNRVGYRDYNGNMQYVAGKVGDIVVNSSKGPSRTGLQKPNIAASGNIALSAVSFPVRNNLLNNNQSYKLAEGGMHLRNGGTSMASPVVAGIVALYLQRCPNTKVEDIVAAINDNAKSDAFTGNLPNNSWGFGKVDALKTLKATIQSPKLMYLGNGTICGEDSLLLGVEGNFTQYQWANSLESQSITVFTEDTFFVKTKDGKGCWQYSDTLVTIKSSLPEINSQNITQCEPDTFFDLTNAVQSNADTVFFYELLSEAKEGLNNLELPNKVMHGNYYLRGENIKGCYQIDSIESLILPMPQLPAIAIVNNLLEMQYHGEEFQWYLNSQPINEATDSIYGAKVNGWYKVKVTNQYNCSAFSDSLQVLTTKNSLWEKTAAFFEVMPNPTKDILWIKPNAKVRGSSLEVQILDAIGRQLITKKITLLKSQIFSVDLNSLKKGVYFVRVKSENQIGTQKIFKN